ncbi:MAG: LuxR C-terminal-related transcriptional regulator [Anaerolineae bacterium]
MNGNYRSFPLAQAKLRRPQLTAGLIIRPRLFDLLDRGRRLPLTLVCAPAGFGKTTLVSSWIETLAHGDAAGSAWVSLDESDNNLSAFLYALVAAIRSVVPEACSHTRDLILAPTAPAADLLTATLLDELDALPVRIMVVLEDFHLIHREEVLELTRRLVNSATPGVHWLITSRSTPPLPLARLRAAGQVSEIRSRDLRFTAGEAKAFLSAVLASPLEDWAIDSLYERTEGWIVGLRLAALSLASAENVESAIRAIQGTESTIHDYLLDEVLERQPPEVQTFLRVSSILDRFSDDLLAAVIGGGVRAADTRSLLDFVSRSGLLVFPLDSAHEWFRYHALFRDMLYERLQQDMSPPQIADLHRRASNWYGEHGLWDDAILHALSAHDRDLAADWMEAGLIHVLNREDRLTLEHWLSWLPEEFIQRRPYLLVMKAWALEFAWQIDAQTRVLAQIEALLEEVTPDPPNSHRCSIIRGQMAVIYAQAAYFAGRPRQAIELSDEALANMPANWQFVRGAATMLRGLGLQAEGQSNLAIREQIEFYESAVDRSTSYAIRPLMTLCFIQWLSGYLDQVSSTAETLVAKARDAGLPILESWGHYFAGVASYARNDLDTAREQFEIVFNLRHATQMLTSLGGAYGLVLCYHAVGDAKRARHIVDVLSGIDRSYHGLETERTRSIRARLFLLEGAIPEALTAIGGPPSSAAAQPLLWLDEPPLTRCRVLLSAGSAQDRAEALQLLEALDDSARRAHNVPALIETLVLRAWALCLAPESQGEAAEQTLREAIHLARVGGFVRVFLEPGTPVLRVLRRLATDEDADFVRHILRIADAGTPASDRGESWADRLHANRSLPEPLSIRELEILSLMSQRLTDKEIASRLSISPKTVKRHAANLYGKLGVSRRWDAVEKAFQLGMLPID